LFAPFLQQYFPFSPGFLQQSGNAESGAPFEHFGLGVVVLGGKYVGGGSVGGRYVGLGVSTVFTVTLTGGFVVSVGRGKALSGLMKENAKQV
jgi:hypothetical protein